MSEDTISYILSRPSVSQEHFKDHAFFYFDENWVEINPKHVSEWQDFTQQNLDNAYGHLLKLKGPELEDEGWYNRLEDYLPMALESSAKIWLPPQMASDATIVRRVLPDRQDQYSYLDHPSRTITLVTSQGEIPLVVETACLGWKANDVLRGAKEKGDKSFYPIQEAATFCIQTGTRYAAISTWDGLVVACICYDDETSSSVNVRLKFIPNEGPMTANFGLWCLGMLALNEEHRGIKCVRETPLNVWRRVGGPNKKTTALEHHISKRRVRNQSDIPGADIQDI
ncbi:hypothetical protein V494_08586 [Pseudogymnoascus sp. VKM F-4513 (FW-928)]|nr:hypothetical protein V494_08586 [Pseudogymnoascus sp. VKM F-4513 (FW-928)]